MTHKAISLPFLGALAMLASSSLAIDAYRQTAHAQTQGMERRQNARDVKHECNASADTSRAECRQEKRNTKQEDRNGGSNQPANSDTNAPSTSTNPNTQPNSPPHA